MADSTPPTGSPDASQGDAQHRGAAAAGGFDQTRPLTVGAGQDATRLTSPGVKPSVPAAPATPATPAAPAKPPAAAPSTAASPEETRPTHPLDATRVTTPAEGGQDAIRTIANQSLSDQRTMVSSEQSPPFGSAVSSQTPGSGGASSVSAGGVGSAAYSRSSMTQRVSRTKLKRSLPPDAQKLDAKLQVSRPSVLADLVSSRPQDELPSGIRRLIEEQGTEGRYAINKELAHGGMGAVLDISDHDFRRRAAMKVILSQYASSHEAMERFLAEAQVTAQLEHPNIVPIHDLGVMEDGTLYFTMKMIEGTSLGRVVKLLQQQAGILKRDGQAVPPDDESKAAAAHWTEQQKLHVFLKVLDGVGFAHSRGVIHRDLKPDNIMLGAHGEVLVVDWGIAKVKGLPDTAARAPMGGITEPAASGVVSIRSDDAASATMAGATMGTVYYMPPEQAQGDLARVDARSDIYALGATLYELLALKRTLKQGSSIQEMLSAIVEGRWVPLDEADPSLDKDLVAIVHRSMAREPLSRYATCEAFADDIRRYMAGAAVAARRRSTREIVSLWVAQNRARIIGTLVVLALILGGIKGALLMQASANRAEAAGILAKARADLQDLPADARAEQLQPIHDLLVKAHAKDAGSKDLDDFTRQVDDRFAVARSREEELSRRKALKDQAAQLLAEATSAMAAGDPDSLDKAKSKLAQASDLADSREIEQALAEVNHRLLDTHRAQRMQELNRHADAARDALTSAEALPREDQHLDGLLRSIDGELAFADADKDLKVSGLPALFTRAQKLRAGHERALQEALDLQRGRALAASSTAALQGRDSAKALADAEQALAFAPSDPAVLAAYKAGSDAKAIADAHSAEQKRRADAEARAAPLIDQVRTRVAAARAAADAVRKDRAEVARLTRALADKPLDQKKPLFDARELTEAHATAALREWQQGEQIAQQALALLEPWAGSAAPPKAYLAAESLLAMLYHDRLAQARADRDASVATVMATLLARADRYDHAYAADFADVGTVTVRGVRDGALVQARRLSVSSDGRLLPIADPAQVPFDQPRTYAIGAWQFTCGDTMISAVVAADRPLAITFPGPAPKVPGLALRYVPADLHRERDGSPGNLKPFWLGVTEVTYEQYLAFLRDPDIFDQVRKSIARAASAAGEDQNGLAAMAQIPLLPCTLGGSPLYKLVFQDKSEKKLTAIDPMPETPLNVPVADLYRNDAEAYCGWLSKKSGVVARLPFSREWQFAADGDDPQRVYPWGPVFDGNFCASSAVETVATAVPVGTPAADIGPFGHLDLAGGVREWLGDRPSHDDARAAGAFKGLFAGGAFGDDSQVVFRCDYRESAPPDETRNPIIGFRVLVEQP